ncbi:MAG TPA: lytic transglycosylase domain-containing protein [Longimicrobiales bacterium]|nr:lytic transglycosylase domain-containing protein [Longimicrobiales bacterium]
MKSNSGPRRPGRTSDRSTVTSRHRGGSLRRTARSLGILSGVMVASYSFTSSTTAGAPAVEPTLEPILADMPPDALRPDVPDWAHERVDYWIGRFTSDQRPTFEVFLTQEGAFGQLIRERLRERGMPPRLLYLAMIESGLRPAAVSHVSAVGVWQFMGPTAQAYGLRVDDWVDERRDPVSATDAALDYLEWLHDRYGSWYLAVSAYNAGPSRVDRALRRARIGIPATDEAYWQIRPFLPFETREYVPRLLAASALAEEPMKYGFADVEGHRPYEFDSVWVPGGTPMVRVARSLGEEYRVIWALNPHLVRGMTPPGEPYPLRVPVGTAFQVVASLGRLPRQALHAADD